MGNASRCKVTVGTAGGGEAGDEIAAVNGHLSDRTHEANRPLSSRHQGIPSTFESLKALFHRPPVGHQAGKESVKLRAMVGVA